jgi:type IV pilus assembly protein PilB
VDFNESFASFVELEGAMTYVRDKYGVESEEYKKRILQEEESSRVRFLFHKLAQSLNTIYESNATDEEKKLIDRVVAEFKTSEAKAKFLDEFKKEGQENFYKLHKGLGCKECNGFGYKGRLAVHEGIYMSKEIEELAANNPSEREIQEVAGKQGFLTLREDTMLKILRGTTTVEEAMKIVDMYGSEVDRQPELENKNFK